MATALVPFMAQSLSNPGYDAIFRPAFLLHNMSEGGACIGSALREKDPEKRAEIFSLAIGCIFAGFLGCHYGGISNFHLKNILYAPIAGKYITLKDIGDGVFSEGMLGQGCGIIPESGIVLLPVNGEVVSIADSLHAIG